MSDYDKSTCPVCFTKMRNIKKVLTCPECGYKYCDHNRDLQNMFDTTHTHAPNYTTYTKDTTYTQSTTSYPNTNSQTSANNKNFTNTYSSSGKTTYTSSGQKSNNKNVGKIVKIIVIIYILTMFCPVGCGALFTAIGVIGEMANDDNSPEIQITSDLVEEDSTIEDIWANIDADAPATVPGEDGDLIPELIKHIFDVDSVEEVTNADVGTIYALEIRPTYDDTLYIYYYTTDDKYGTFDYEGSEFAPKDLETFFALQSLYTPYTRYEEGDLENLSLLNTLSCQNTPAELTQVLNPTQLVNLTLTLPDDTDTLEGLECFTELLHLEIDATNALLTDSSQISELSKLYALYYTDYNEDTDYHFLNSLPELENLCLCAPGLKDLSFAENMEELRYLQINENSNITDLSPLTHVADSLIILDLAYCYELRDFAPVSKLYNLEYLGLDACRVDDLSFASGLDNLDSLSISETTIETLEPIKDLPSLEYIYAWDATINDYAGLQDLVYE